MVRHVSYTQVAPEFPIDAMTEAELLAMRLRYALSELSDARETYRDALLTLSLGADAAIH